MITAAVIWTSTVATLRPAHCTDTDSACNHHSRLQSLALPSDIQLAASLLCFPFLDGITYNCALSNEYSFIFHILESPQIIFHYKH